MAPSWRKAKSSATRCSLKASYPRRGGGGSVLKSQVPKVIAGMAASALGQLLLLGRKLFATSAWNLTLLQDPVMSEPLVQLRGDVEHSYGQLLLQPPLRVLIA